VTPEALAAFEATEAVTIFGVRAGSKTRDLHIPGNLPPGELSKLLPLTVQRVESLRPGTPMVIDANGAALTGRDWREDVKTQAEVLGRFEDGHPAWIRSGKRDYLAFAPQESALNHVLSDAAKRAGLTADLVKAALADEGWRKVAEDNRAEMFANGLWGVPSFRVDDGPAHWGQDRLWVIEQDLKA
jgi:beta-galactosidase GanA